MTVNTQPTEVETEKIALALYDDMLAMWVIKIKDI